jgi:putative ABC transport system permease protein
VLRIDKNQPIADVVTMETLLSISVARSRFATQVMAAFAFIAFPLAIVGIYGVISYDVEQRTRETGIRLALGAQRASVIRLMLKQGMVLAGAGIGFGVIVSAWNHAIADKRSLRDSPE